MSNIFDVLEEGYDESSDFSDALNFLESEENSDESYEESEVDDVMPDVASDEIEEEASHYLEAAENLDKIIVEDPYSGEF